MEELLRDARAFDELGRQHADVLIFMVGNGNVPHLVDTAASAEALCGRMPTRPSHVWFAISGCARCEELAVRARHRAITDIDGKHIALPSAENVMR